MGQKMKKSMIALLTLALVAGQLPILNLNNSLPVAQAQTRSEQEWRDILDEANREIADHRAEETRLSREIDELMDQIAEYQGLIEEAETEIARLQDEIAEVEAAIEVLEEEIQQGEDELELINEEIGELTELITERMQATQRSRFSNVWLELLSNSPDLLSFIRNVNMMANLLEHDARLMDRLNELVEAQEALLAQLAAQRLELGGQRLGLMNMRSAVETEVQRLGELQAVVATQQNALASERESIREDLAASQDDANLAAEQLRQFEQMRNQSSGGGGATGSGGGGNVSGVSGGGHFIIPLERGRVTCEWGNVCYFGHTGIDLQLFGATGSNRVLAAADGTVTASGYARGWGWRVVMTHNINGQMYTTMYAHLHSAPYVSVGDVITQGTVLGRQGTSGWTIGSGHLHFEIHRGAMTSGGSINPREFVHFPSSW